jgi:16S rRNA (cytidine1402-2'-O)-methyltransferase
MTEQTVKPGCLYMVATPLGNLDDITYRAVEVLRAVDVIACEDTRHSRRLFARYEIHTELISYHEHNESTAAERIASMLSSGESVALVTDAGTPGISDPGYRIANLAAERGLNVIPVPGPSSLTAALSVAGLPTDSFYFAGFLPPKRKATEDTFESLREMKATLVFFCPARRLVRVLGSAREVLGNRDAAVCREMTKVYEEVVRGRLDNLAAELAGREGDLKGEVVLLIGGDTGGEAPDEEELETRLEEMLSAVEAAEEMGARRLTALAAEKMNVRRNQLYPLVCAWLNARQGGGQ